MKDEDGGARITRSPALVGLDCWVTIFVDRFWACGGVVVGSEFDLGVCLREVWRGESLGGVVEFGAILLPKGASVRQCAGRKNAW